MIFFFFYWTEKQYFVQMIITDSIIYSRTRLWYSVAFKHDWVWHERYRSSWRVWNKCARLQCQASGRNLAWFAVKWLMLSLSSAVTSVPAAVQCVWPPRLSGEQKQCGNQLVTRKPLVSACEWWTKCSRTHGLTDWRASLRISTQSKNL